MVKMNLSVYLSLLACFLISKVLAKNDTDWTKSMSEEPRVAELTEEGLNCFESLCIPQKYDRTKIPSGVQVFVNFLSAAEALNKVDDHQMMITFEPKVFMIWKDPSVTFPSNSSFGGATVKQLSDSMLDKIWLPRITIEHATPRKNSYHDPGKIDLFLMKDETVQKEFQVEGVESQSDEGSDVYVALFQKITWDIYCKMDFTYFPVDNQVCRHPMYPEDWTMPLQLLLTNENATDPFGVMSAGDSSQETTFMKQEALNLEYDVAVSLKTVDNGYEATSGIELEILMTRKGGYIIIGPPALLVLVSWVSFLVPKEAIPGRLGLLLTIFLCMVNTLNSTQRTSPKSGGNASAIIQWIISCLIFIILAIFEYAWILSHKTLLEARKAKATNLERKGSIEKMQECFLKLFLTLADDKRLDKIMFFLFPAVFLPFAAVFWSMNDAR